MRRGCLFGIIGLLGVCVVGCALGYFVALPRVRNELRDPFKEVIGTQVARVAAPTPGEAPEPGTYVLDAADLNTAIRERIGDTSSFDNIGVTLAPTGYELGFTTNNQEVTYGGQISAVDGRLEVTNVTDSGGVVGFVLPAREVADIFEDTVNDYLAANNLRLTEATLGDGTLTLTTEQG